MNTQTDSTKARFQVQRQDTVGGEWRPVTLCNSLEFAQMVAEAGLRNDKGVAYGAVELETGMALTLLPAAKKAA